MHYLKIENAGSMNRRYTYLFGLSQKRDQTSNERTIGFKGTGLKLAMMGALQLGLKMLVTSVDKQGLYMIEPFARPMEIDDIEYRQLCYRYYRPALPTFWERQRNRLKKISVKTMAVDAVKETDFLIESVADFIETIGADDKHIFKTVRELICNAYDADQTFHVSYVREDQVCPAKENQTIVYLECTPELTAIFQAENRSRYFKLFRNCPLPVWGREGIGWMYPKSDAAMTRMFVRGVLAGVSAAADQNSCFDYSLVNQQILSEGREIKDVETYRYAVSDILTTVISMHLAAIILEAVACGQGGFENQSVFWPEYLPPPNEATRMAYAGAWRHLFGERAILPGGQAGTDHRAQESGYELKQFALSRGFRQFLMACGIKTSNDVVPKQGNLKMIDVSIEQISPEARNNFIEARDIFYRWVPAAKNTPVRLFRSEDPIQKKYHGFAGRMETEFKEICLNVEKFDVVKEILKTFIHEYRHCASKASDYTIQFVEAADEEYATLLLQLEQYIQ